MANSEFEVRWPGDKEEPVDIYAEPKPNQQTLRIEFYEQPVLEGLEETSVEDVSVSDTPTFSVVDSIKAAVQFRCGRQIG